METHELDKMEWVAGPWDANGLLALWRWQAEGGGCPGAIELASDDRFALAGGAAGRMKGGRHIRYAEPAPLSNLHLTLLDKVGVRLDAFADSKGKIRELDEPLAL